MEIQDLDQFTVSQLTEIFNTFNQDEKPIKAFRSRKQAVDRLAALDNFARWGATLRDDGHVEYDTTGFVPVEVSDGEPDGQTETVDALEDVQGSVDHMPEETPAFTDAAAAVDAAFAFVKATKEQLGAMDATERATYRRRRRAAARTARRLRAAS